MMSKNDSEDAFSDMPMVSRSDSAGSNSSSKVDTAESDSKVTRSISGTHTTDSVVSGGDADSELESAESSAVSLSDGVSQTSFQAGGEGNKEVATPSLSPLAQEVIAASKLSGRNSPATSLVRHLSTDTPPSPLFLPKNPFLDLGGKITKFKWTPSHIDLLEELLISLSGSVDKWKRYKV